MNANINMWESWGCAKKVFRLSRLQNGAVQTRNDCICNLLGVLYTVNMSDLSLVEEQNAGLLPRGQRPRGQRAGK